MNELILIKFSNFTHAYQNDYSHSIRKWVPTLKHLPKAYIYEPWRAPIKVQKQYNVIIGKDYPKPIVDHVKVSKENMSKMAYAYDLHKEKMKENEKKIKGSTKRKTTTSKTTLKTKDMKIKNDSSINKEPKNKKQKKLTDF